MTDDGLKSFIDDLAERLALVSRGRLDLRLRVRGDASGPLADAVNVVLASFRGIVLEVRSRSQSVIESGERIRATMEAMNSSTRSASKKVDEIGQGLRSLGGGLDEIQSAARGSREVVTQSELIAAECRESAASAAGGMEEVRESIQGASKRVKRLAESSQEIGEAIRVIDDIADQTNVLAVNAAIQSAMAGEAGEGFAIIAEEIRRLASQARDGMRDIEALVKSVQSESAEAMAAVEQTTTGVVASSEALRRTGSALARMSDLSEKTAAATNTVEHQFNTHSRLLGEVAKRLPQAAEGLNAVREDVKELGGFFEQSLGAAIELRNVSMAYVMGDDTEMAEIAAPKEDTGTVVLKPAQLSTDERRRRRHATRAPE